MMALAVTVFLSIVRQNAIFIFVFLMCSLLAELGLMPSSRIVFQCIVNVDFISDDYLKEGTVL